MTSKHAARTAACMIVKYVPSYWHHVGYINKYCVFFQAMNKTVQKSNYNMVLSTQTNNTHVCNIIDKLHNVKQNVITNDSMWQIQTWVQVNSIAKLLTYHQCQQNLNNRKKT